MGYNPVLDSTGFLIQEPKYVFINEGKLKEIAKKFASEDLKIPSWKEPIFPENNDKSTIDFFLLAHEVLLL